MRTALLVGVAVLVAAAIALAELRRADDVVAAEARRRELGAHVVVIRPRQPGDAVPPAACDGLALEPWVVAAGGVRVAGPVVLTQRPGSGVQVVEVTALVPAIWAAAEVTTAQPGWLVPEPLAATLGIVGGAFLAPAGTAPEPVAATFAAPRHPDADRWLVRVVPAAGRFGECWVETAPDAFDGALAALPLTFPTDRFQLTPRLPVRDGVSVDPRSEFTGRAERHLWLPAGLVVAALWWLAAWARRAELGLYRATGTSRRAVVVLLQLELVLVVVAMALGAVHGAAAHAALGGGSSPSALVVVARNVGAAAAVAWLLAAPAGAVLTRRSIAALLKDR